MILLQTQTEVLAQAPPHFPYWLEVVSKVGPTIAFLGFALSLISHFQGRAKAKTESALQFMEQYANIQAELHKDILETQRMPTPTLSPDDVSDAYYKKLIDLMWLEFESFRMGYLRKRDLAQWAIGRAVMFKDKKPVIAGSNATYDLTWTAVKNAQYFGSKSMYEKFIDEIHATQGDRVRVETTIERYSDGY